MFSAKVKADCTTQYPYQAALGCFIVFEWQLKLFNIKSEVERNLDRLLHPIFAVVDIDVGFQLVAVAHYLLTPL